MHLYTVSDDYISYLQRIDSNVPNNYDEGRAYVGVVLVVNNKKYLAPLTSYKTKQNRLSSSAPTLLKIYEKDNSENPLGMVQLNNMIPVIDGEIRLLDIDSQPKRYGNMLKKQLIYLKQEEVQTKLFKKAKKLYKYVALSKHEFYSSISCDFLRLERAAESYVKTKE